MQIIVDEINRFVGPMYCMYTYRYAAACIDALRQNDHLTSRSHFMNWRPISRSDLRAFLAVVLNMGLIEVPTLEGYWWTLWEPEIPFFRRLMSRDRFLQIFWMLHVGEGDRRIDKVKPICDALIQNFQYNYHPAQNVADDGWVSWQVWAKAVHAKSNKVRYQRLHTGKQ